MPACGCRCSSGSSTRASGPRQVAVFGADDHYMDIQGGTLLRGRFFTRAELTGEQVIVLETDVAERLFGRLDPLGRYVRVGGRRFRVIGIYQKPDNIFEPPGQEIGGVMPFETARQNFRYDETNDLFIAVRPRPGGCRWTGAQDAVTVALRRAAEPPARHAQHLRPDHPGPDPRRGRQVSPPTSSSRWWRSPAWPCWSAASA